MINNSIIVSDQRGQLWENVSHSGLFNGNITWMVTDLPAIASAKADRTKGMQGMVYQYDQLHRITKSKSLINYMAGSWQGQRGSGFPIRPANSVYDEKYSYDANGNITTLQRNDELATLKDDFAYSYYDTTNRLMQHKVSSGLYYYDAIGNLVKDDNEGVTITWTPYGKVRTVHKGDSVMVSYRYDAAGNRVEKKVVKDSTTTITKYLRDASGNVMTIYKDIVAIEVPVYGSARLGEYKGGVIEGERSLGHRNFELSNHLGNVLTVITDNLGMMQDSVWATVISVSDYYPFGLEMKGRSWNDTTSTYRYGFNGKEKDSAFASTTDYDYGFRIYSPEIGKFLSVDPLIKKFPSWSPYAFAMNRPIDGKDLDGLEWSKSIETDQTGSSIHIVNKLDVKIRVVNQSTIVTSQPDVDLILSNFKREAEKDFYSIQIEKDEDNDVIEETVLNITFDQTPLKPGETLSHSTGFFMALEDQKTVTNPVTGNQELTAGSSIACYVPGKTQKNLIHLAVTVDGVRTTPSGYSRAGTHELGHTGGLPHPWMASENSALKIKDADQSNPANKTTVKNNLMNSDENPISGMRSTKGTQVTKDQIKSIIQTVSKQQPKKK